MELRWIQKTMVTVSGGGSLRRIQAWVPESLIRAAVARGLARELQAADWVEVRAEAWEEAWEGVIA